MPRRELSGHYCRFDSVVVMCCRRLNDAWERGNLTLLESVSQVCVSYIRIQFFGLSVRQWP